MAQRLRVVPTPQPASPRKRKQSKPAAKSLQAAADQSSRELLVKMRTLILSQINSDAPPHTLAPLSRRVFELDKEVRAMDIKAAQVAEDRDAERAAEQASKKLLTGMRNTILARIDQGVPAHALAPLSRRIIELDKEISAIDTRAEQAAADDGSADDDAWNPDEI